MKKRISMTVCDDGMISITQNFVGLTERTDDEISSLVSLLMIGTRVILADIGIDDMKYVEKYILCSQQMEMQSEKMCVRLPMEASKIIEEYKKQKRTND